MKAQESHCRVVCVSARRACAPSLGFGFHDALLRDGGPALAEFLRRIRLLRRDGSLQSATLEGRVGALFDLP